MTTSKYIRSSYAVCTNPRSGSWLLCDGLASTGLAGNPREWFNSVEERDQRSKWNVGYFSKPIYSAYLEHVRELGASPNGIFGIKLHYYQFAELTSKFTDIEEYRGLSQADLLPNLFPEIRYIWLRRRDKMRQAISYYRACQSKQWWLLDGAQSRTSNLGIPDFDPHAVERMENILIQNDASWQRYFEAMNLTPFEIFYEDLASDYVGTLQNILCWLDLPGAKAVYISPPRLQQQSDARTGEWLARYSDFKNGQRCENAEPSAISLTAPGQASPPSAQQGTKPKLEPSVLESPLFVRSRAAPDALPDAWKQWIGQNKLRRIPDESMVGILTAHGYSAELVSAEVRRAASDPYLLAALQVQQKLDKVLSVLDVLQQVTALHPRATQIERRSNVPRSEFLERYYSANRPVVLQGLMTGWKAMALWSADYLKHVAGGEQVEVMLGRESDPQFEINSYSHRQVMQFCEYVDLVYQGLATNDYYLVANNKFFQRPAGQVLLGDIDVCPEYLDPSSVENQLFLWFGPGGTITPLHHDTSNILMAQVLGRKRVQLIAPYQWGQVYNEIGVFSRVDCDHPDFERYPEFKKVEVLEVILEPGEVLFMPVGWWHQVRSLDVSIMVSFTNFVFPNHYRWPRA